MFESFGNCDPQPKIIIPSNDHLRVKVSVLSMQRSTPHRVWPNVADRKQMPGVKFRPPEICFYSRILEATVLRARNRGIGIHKSDIRTSLQLQRQTLVGAWHVAVIRICVGQVPPPSFGNRSIPSAIYVFTFIGTNVSNVGIAFLKFFDDDPFGFFRPAIDDDYFKPVKYRLGHKVIQTTPDKSFAVISRDNRSDQKVRNGPICIRG